MCNEDMLITGDFNIHLNDRIDVDATKFQKIGKLTRKNAKSSLPSCYDLVRFESNYGEFFIQKINKI